MRLKKVPITVERGQEMQETLFGTSNLAFLFEILRSHMYPNPIKTIVQEIGSNARDAHREIDIPNRPIEITLPNGFNNHTFQIRDFGPGINPQRMLEVFIQYGESTKIDSDEQTGGFGLGAKTPFAYGDSFTIVTVTPEYHYEDHENCYVKREYVAYIDETRLGSLSTVYEGVTSEPQGTTIIVPCNPEDERKFSDWVIDRMKYWQVKPIIYGDSEFSWPKIERKFEGEKWFITSLHPNYAYHSQGDPVALIDEIPYPIDLSMLNLDNEVHEKIISLLSRYKVILEFNIEEMPVASNRESIDYSQSETKSFLISKLSSVYDDLIKFYNDSIINAENLWDAILILKSSNFLFDEAEWKEIPVSLKSISFEKFSAQHWAVRKINSGLRVKDISYFLVNDESVMILDDNPDHTMKPSRARLKTIFENHVNIDTIIIIRPPCFNDLNVDLGSLENEEQRKQRKDKLRTAIRDIEEVGHLSKYGATPISDFAKYKPPRKEYGSENFASVTEAYLLDENQVWTQTDIRDIPTDAYYIPIFRHAPIVGTVKMNNSIFAQMLQELWDDEKERDIVGIPLRFEKKVKGKLWSLQDVINRKIARIQRDNDLKCLLNTDVARFSVHRVASNFFKKVLESKCFLAKLIDPSLIQSYINVSLQYEESVVRIQKVKTLASLFRIEVDNAEASHNEAENLAKVFAEVIVHYPLLMPLRYYSMRNDIDYELTDFPVCLEHYLNMCDEKAKGVTS